LDEARIAAGIDQQGLDDAARKGFPVGAFEESAEEGETVVEEFYLAPDKVADQNMRTYPVGDSLHRKLGVKLHNSIV